jgi:hypothetical protein
VWLLSLDLPRLCLRTSSVNVCVGLIHDLKASAAAAARIFAPAFTLGLVSVVASSTFHAHAASTDRSN